MLGDCDLSGVISRRPTEMSNLTPADWEQLADLWDSGEYRSEFEEGLANGCAFGSAPDTLNGRRPRIIQWTGGRRPRGDEVVPSDLRVDHVYLVSCKYLSKILHNPVRPLTGRRLAFAYTGRRSERLVQPCGAHGVPATLRSLRASSPGPAFAASCKDLVSSERRPTSELGSHSSRREANPLLGGRRITKSNGLVSVVSFIVMWRSVGATVGLVSH